MLSLSVISDIRAVILGKNMDRQESSIPKILANKQSTRPEASDEEIGSIRKHCVDLDLIGSVREKKRRPNKSTMSFRELGAFMATEEGWKNSEALGHCV